MIAPITDIPSSTSSTKHETAKQWLQRRLRKAPSTRPIDQQTQSQYVPAWRPRTAPSSGVNTVPAIPPLPIDIPLPLRNASVLATPRPARPDSGTMRNVDAWLDTSITTHSPPLMGGLPYWRKAIGTNAKDTVGMQHATPIVWKPEVSRPSTAQSGSAKPIRRRAKRSEVQLPVSARDKPGGGRSRKQANRHSNSVPVLSIPYDSAQQGPLPTPLVSAGVLVVPFRGPSQVNAAITGNELSPDQIQFPDSSRGSRSSGLESSIEQYRHAFFGLSARSVDSTRPSTAAARVPREDSMGDVSDVPSYFSGLPPPSYQSRPASILTTSSFGCIDGMNPAQRQISQQRAAAQRGVRGKLKRLAQSFTSST